MYKLNEAYNIMGGTDKAGMWDGKIFCATTNAANSWLPNDLEETVSCYSFNIVLNGHMRLISGTQEVHLGKNELYTYMPGFPFRVLDISSDYRGICLIVDETTAHDTPAFRYLIQTSYFPLAHFGVPKQALSADDATRLSQLMHLIHDHIVAQSSFKDEALHMLLSVFMIDLRDIQQRTPRSRHITNRNEELFISFFSLLRQHFMEHHDIGYYADRMNITTTHLSRIVKQVTGRTVISFIDQMLAMEATWLLSTSGLTITQIADSLHFATTASFDKFFIRMSGHSPKQFRNMSTDGRFLAQKMRMSTTPKAL